jgi:Ca2+-binding EF-hand superfamily protein
MIDHNDFELPVFDSKKLPLLKTLDQDQIEELLEIFVHFMNPLTKVVNLKDVITAMKLLDSSKQNFLITSIFEELDKKYENDDLDFTRFVLEIDKNIVN